MSTVSLSDIALSPPEREALYLIAQIISRGDTTFRTHDGAGAGAWGMSTALYGGPPPDAAGQARVAAARWREIRGGFAADLPLDGTGRMLALLLVAWFCPAQYVTAAPKKTVQEILGAAGLSSWVPRVLATQPIMASLAAWSGAPNAGVGPTGAAEQPQSVAPPSKPSKAALWPWFLILGAAAFGVWYWHREHP